MQWKALIIVALVASFWGSCANPRQDRKICIGSFSIMSETDWKRVSDCSIIEGSLFLDDSADAIMRGDIEIEEVAGNLIVSGVGQTRSLAGFSRLIRIGGDLEISNTIHLKKIAAFNNLFSIGGSLIVKDNWSLKEIDGLENLVHVDGDLKIANNESLERIGRDAKLKKIGGAVEIESNRRLVELELTQAIEEIGRNREGNTHQKESGLGPGKGEKGRKKGKEVNGNREPGREASVALVVRNCEALKDMAAFSSVRTVNGRIEISYNMQMASLVGLENLQYVKGPVVFWLPSLIGLEAIRTRMENESKRYVIAINGLEELERSVDKMKGRFFEAGKPIVIERGRYTKGAGHPCIDEPEEL